MKKASLLLVLFFTAVSLNVMSNVCTNAEVDQIELSGYLSGQKQRSLTKPVQVLKRENSLQVNFSANLGTIVISVYDGYGDAVYQQPVNTFAGQQVYIDITSLDSGEYTIEFVNSLNQYLAGGFEIE